MSEENASAQSDAALAGNEGSTDAPEVTPGPMSRIESYFLGQESGNQVDNKTESSESGESGESASTQEAEDTEGDKPAETATEGEADKTGGSDKASKTDEAAEAADGDAEEEAANFKALEKGAETDEPILDTPEAVKEKFPRNSSNELVATTAKYGQLAKRGQEVISALGGEDFIPGMTTIAGAIKEGNPRNILVGIANTGGPEELVKVVADGINMAMLQSDAMMENPETKPIATALKAIFDAGLKDKFGPNMTSDRMGQLALWDQAGWFDKITEWMEAGYVDPEEVKDLIETSSDTAAIRLAAENRELKAQLEGKNAKAETPNKGDDAKAATATAQVDNSFHTLATDGISKTLNDVVLKTSVLKAVESDSPEIAAAKTALRDVIAQAAVSNFKNSDGYTKLLESYRTGKRDTANFKTDLATAISQAVLGTKEQTSVWEGLVAKAIGRSRNTQLASKAKAATASTTNSQGTKASDAGTQTTQEPTQTTPANTKPRTREDIVAALESRLQAIGQ